MGDNSHNFKADGEHWTLQSSILKKARGGTCPPITSKRS